VDKDDRIGTNVAVGLRFVQMGNASVPRSAVVESVARTELTGQLLLCICTHLSFLLPTFLPDPSSTILAHTLDATELLSKTSIDRHRGPPEWSQVKGLSNKTPACTASNFPPPKRDGNHHHEGVLGELALRNFLLQYPMLNVWTIQQQLPAPALASTAPQDTAALSLLSLSLAAAARSPEPTRTTRTSPRTGLTSAGTHSGLSNTSMNGSSTTAITTGNVYGSAPKMHRLSSTGASRRRLSDAHNAATRPS
jgi:hypothetical protein